VKSEVTAKRRCHWSAKRTSSRFGNKVNDHHRATSLHFIHFTHTHVTRYWPRYTNQFIDPSTLQYRTANNGAPTLRRRQGRPRVHTTLSSPCLLADQPHTRPLRVLRRSSSRCHSKHGILRNSPRQHPTIQPRTLPMVRLHSRPTHINNDERTTSRRGRRSRLKAYVQANLPGHKSSGG
jgi:hypothetical protein